ncbi:transposase [Pseudomonas sp. IT-P258]|uniref:transposase n=1 Tax=Pseudomonas sp. IT-P258 TaxID=3026447 RepID=UPI0039E06D25
MHQRSSYPKSFKAQVVQERLQPGATISSVGIHHGINANVIRKWLPNYRDHTNRYSSCYPCHAARRQLMQTAIILLTRCLRDAYRCS